MLPDAETMRYLTGRAFSNGRAFSVPPSRAVIPRDARLCELVRGRSVLHVGCCDHLELIQQKRREGRYLHDLLGQSACRLVGMDTNIAGVELMRQLGYEETYTPSDIPVRQFDMVVVPDVIEHVPDPEAFLRELRRYALEQVVVTTPNVYRLQNRLQLRAEVINTDHRHWFSPYTLSKAVIGSGLRLVSLEYTDRPSRRNLLRNSLLARFPLLRDGLMAIAAV